MSHFIAPKPRPYLDFLSAETENKFLRAQLQEKREFIKLLELENNRLCTTLIADQRIRRELEFENVSLKAALLRGDRQRRALELAAVAADEPTEPAEMGT